MKNLSVRKVLAFIGPYPYNPYLIFLFFWSIVFSRLLPVVTDQPRGTTQWSATGVVLLLSFIPPSLFASAAYLMQKYRNRGTQSLPRYIIEVAIIQSLAFLYSPFLHFVLKSSYEYNFESLSTSNLRAFLGSLFFVLLALALMHRAERKIVNRLSHANELVTRLEIDRTELIRADEDLREQTSRFLHDSVQAELMIVGMKLKSISGKSTTEVNEVIDRSLVRLERIRATDLRNLIQVLTPIFDAGGIKQAIQSLADQYQTSMKIFIEVDDVSETIDRNNLLGVFRISEQSILNSLVHGPATKVVIKLTTTENGKSELVISDDGPGADLSSISHGVGTAIMDSWVGILEGKKTVDTVPGHGYRLVVNFPDN